MNTQSPKHRCLIADKMHESIVPMLQEIGLQPDYQPSIQREEILGIIENYTGLVIRSKTNVDQALIAKAVNLRFVARAGAGLDQLDEQALNARHIAILNAPEGNRDALAEHNVGMLLTLMHKIHTGNRQIREGTWDREGNRGTELMGKTIGIVGYGNMGQAFAHRLTGFSVKVLAYDKYRQNYGDRFAQQAAMEQLYEESDVLSFHVPLTAETLFFVDDSYLSRFSKNIFLLNTARGKIIKLKTLAEALTIGKVQGAALDVLENEKLNQLSEEQQRYFQELIQSDKVIFTPHVAGWTHESYEKINRVLVDKIKALKLV